MAVYSGLLDLFLQGQRLGEWVASIAIGFFAFILWLPGDSFAGVPAYEVFVRNGITEEMIGIPLAAIAGVRISALCINGAWRRSPLLRCGGAVLGFVCFGLLVMTVLSPWLTGRVDALSPGLGFIVALAFADLVAAHRSGADVGNVARIDAGRLEISRRGTFLSDHRDHGRHPGYQEDLGAGGRPSSAGGFDPVFAGRYSFDGPSDRGDHGSGPEAPRGQRGVDGGDAG